MKRKLFQVLTLALLSILNVQLSTCFAQGSLTPPGAPAPTMKTLAQIEPRTPISSAPFTISAPGSYYLTTNLTVSGGDAITVAADEVTLDLNGFAISSTAASPNGTGILLSGGRVNVAIYNGSIRGNVTNNGSGVFIGSGFDSGIYYTALIPINIRVKDLSVSGCLTFGIHLGVNQSETVVQSCTVNSAGSYGIVADTVADSIAFACGDDAIYASQASGCHGMSFNGTGIRAKSVQNCYGLTSGNGGGISASTAQNCYGQSVSSAGYGLFGVVAENCQGTCSGNNTGLSANNAVNCFGSSTGSGIGLSVTRTANNCYGTSSSGTGLSAACANNCYGVSTSGTGLSATSIASACYGSSSGGTGLLSAGSADSCYGTTSGGGTGLSAYTAQDCQGISSSGPGLSAGAANNCEGLSATGAGISTSTANNCIGFSSSGTGLRAEIAQNCYGTSSGSGNGTGLFASKAKTALASAASAAVADWLHLKPRTVSVKVLAPAPRSLPKSPSAAMAENIRQWDGVGCLHRQFQYGLQRIRHIGSHHIQIQHAMRSQLQFPDA